MIRSDSSAAIQNSRFALALGGGGARAAYQVGVLRALAREFPDLHVPLLTGVSAGAINVTHLANHTGSFREKVDDLAELWRTLSFDDVFAVSAPALIWQVSRVGMRLSIGLPPGISRASGMVDTKPLRSFLSQKLGTENGPLMGVAKNIVEGKLAALALTALNYHTGETITFVEGKSIEGWERPLRKGINTRLTVDHVMASAALPLLFPPVRIGDDWFGDGGIRLVAPLAPALHLGADRLLVLSTHYAFPDPPPRGAACDEAPSPAVVLSAMYDAVFLDQLDHDVLQMQRINSLVRDLPPTQRAEFRDVETTVIRPSADLGEIARHFEQKLPRTFRYFMRRFGSKERKSSDFISTVMFHEGYIEELLKLGESDAANHCDALARLLSPQRAE